MLELTQTKSSPEVSKPTVVGTAKATDSSMKKMLWHTAMLMAPEMHLVWQCGKCWSPLLLKPAAVLILAGPELMSIQSYPCSTLHSTVVTCAHLLHFHFDFSEQEVFSVSAVPKCEAARTPAVIIL